MSVIINWLTIRWSQNPNFTCLLFFLFNLFIDLQPDTDKMQETETKDTNLEKHIRLLMNLCG